MMSRGRAVVATLLAMVAAVAGAWGPTPASAAGQPDLVIVGTGMGTFTTGDRAGQSFVAVTVQNAGTAAIPQGTRFDVAFHPGDDPTHVWTVDADWAPGVSTLGTFVLSPSLGAWIGGIELDAADAVRESNEQNNYLFAVVEAP
jgi:hypothetical protein